MQDPDYLHFRCSSSFGEMGIQNGMQYANIYLRKITIKKLTIQRINSWLILLWSISGFRKKNGKRKGRPFGMSGKKKYKK